MPDPDRRPSLPATIALIVIGLLILVPSGLCTGFFTIYPIVSAIFDRSGSISADMFSLALLIGGPFIILGGFMVWRGVKRLRG
jgi:NADH:ubiquinone oxidoreductase subunit 5 (subunit L)/multisubunit Na+/H+ antiporter MnhA subunit